MPKATMLQREDAQKTLRTLMPGTKVDLTCGVTAVVYPMGFVHMKEFARELVGAFNTAAAVLPAIRPKDDSKEEKARVERAYGESLIKALAPEVTAELLHVVEACVRFEEPNVTMDQVPHFDVPMIVEAWIMESFGTEAKWRPWLATMERLIKHFSGTEVSILEMFSKPSSPPATVSAT